MSTIELRGFTTFFSTFRETNIQISEGLATLLRNLESNCSRQHKNCPLGSAQWWTEANDRVTSNSQYQTHTSWVARKSSGKCSSAWQTLTLLSCLISLWPVARGKLELLQVAIFWPGQLQVAGPKARSVFARDSSVSTNAGQHLPTRSGGPTQELHYPSTFASPSSLNN